MSSGYNSASVTQPIQVLLDGYHAGAVPPVLGTRPIAATRLLAPAHDALVSRATGLEFWFAPAFDVRGSNRRSSPR